MSQPAHLLSLADLHAAAPGVLDVVFGPDGDFEGAPQWGGPVWGAEHLGDFGPSWYDVSVEGAQLWALSKDPSDPGMTTIPDGALDLRVSTVAARLAGLCARAMGDDASMYNLGTVHCGFLAAQYGMDVESARRLAALTLALAPRIAALRTTASPR